MGMFDSFRDDKGGEWQTKALDCFLKSYRLGDEVSGPPIDYQMEVIGGRRNRDIGEWTFVTIRSGRVAEIPAERDESLPVRNYSSGWDHPLIRDIEGQASVDAVPKDSSV